MRCTFFAGTVLALSVTGAMAASEGKFSKATVSGIEKALTAEGCKGGQIESGDGFYEIGGAECADGKYTIKVDTDFKIIEKKKVQ